MQKMRNFIISCFGQKSNLGFTLIELMVVFSLMTILSGVGIASFVNYSRSQAVDNSLKELRTTIYTARSRALSQLKTGTCGATGSNLQLIGYQVVLCSVPGHTHPSGIACNDNNNAYELQIVCANSGGSGQTSETTLAKKFLDPNITFSNTSTATYFFFATITAAVTTDASSGNSPKAIVTGYSLNKSVSVSQTGVIQ
ncbi:MAG TPA: prepilin-type N-terminal cleavage/methylation domain-containing protein [Patescibacteria group bacterium]